MRKWFSRGWWLSLLLVVGGFSVSYWVGAEGDNDLPAPDPVVIDDPVGPVVDPASKLCVDSGGSEVHKNGGYLGSYIVCQYEGRACETWAMYNGVCPMGGVRTSGYGSDQEMLCAMTGGTVARATNGSEVYCEVPDHSKKCTVTDYYSNGMGCTAVTIGMQNPATVFCEKAGGTVSVAQNGVGADYGICDFGDNRQCEEWAFYHGQCPNGGVKVTGYDTNAQVYCAITGGKVANNGPYALSVCQLPDRSKTCGLQDYFNTGANCTALGGGYACNAGCDLEGATCGDGSTCVNYNGALLCRNSACSDRSSCTCGGGGRTTCNMMCSTAWTTCGDGTTCLWVNGNLTCRNPQCSSVTNCSCGSSNPAETKCLSLGGNLARKVNGANTEYKVCLFPYARQCEVWALYQGYCPDAGVSMAGLNTEAQIYCATTGGNNLKSGGVDYCQTPGQARICNLSEYFSLGASCQDQSAKINKGNLRNPASEYCLNNGGTESTKLNGVGAMYTVCTFAKNKLCEEWALFRQACPVGGVNVSGYSNAAEEYCAMTGGQVQTGSSAVTCTVPDGSKKCPVISYYNNGDSCSEVLRQEFSDVPASQRYYAAIEYLKDKGVVSGYADGTFRPNDYINRAEFTKIIVEARRILGTNVTTPNLTSCFPDVGTDWFAKHVCYARQLKIIGGYPDGKFRPSNYVNFAEALKIVLTAFNVPIVPVAEAPWYVKYLNTAMANSYLNNISELAQDSPLTRGQMCQLIYNIKGH